MKMRPLVLCMASVLALGIPSWAQQQQQDGPPVDLKQLREMLKQIKERRATDEKIAQARILQDIRAAAASNAAAISFYSQAVQAMQFDGKTREQSAFQDWRRDENDKLRSEAMQTAVRLHLNYLLMTLQRAMGTPMEQLEPALQAHINAVLAAKAKDDEIRARRDKAKEMAERNPAMRGKRIEEEPLFSDQALIRQGVSKSIFVQWYGVQKLLDGLKQWEQTPGNIDGIYDSTLMPYYRQAKDPKIIAVWDSRMQRESQQASASNLSFQIDQFNKVRLPAMMWNRAGDEIAVGLRNRGIAEMVNLIKNYPDHPDLPNWIGKLEGVIAPPEESPAPAAN